MINSRNGQNAACELGDLQICLFPQTFWEQILTIRVEHSFSHETSLGAAIVNAS